MNERNGPMRPLSTVGELQAQLRHYKSSNSNRWLVSFSGNREGDTTAAMVLHPGTWKECARFANKMPSGNSRKENPCNSKMMHRPL